MILLEATLYRCYEWLINIYYFILYTSKNNVWQIMSTFSSHLINHQLLSSMLFEFLTQPFHLFCPGCWCLQPGPWHLSLKYYNCQFINHPTFDLTLKPFFMLLSVIFQYISVIIITFCSIFVTSVFFCDSSF